MQTTSTYSAPQPAALQHLQAVHTPVLIYLYLLKVKTLEPTALQFKEENARLRVLFRRKHYSSVPKGGKTVLMRSLVLKIVRRHLHIKYNRAHEFVNSSFRTTDLKVALSRYPIDFVMPAMTKLVYDSRSVIVILFVETKLEARWSQHHFY